MGHTAPKLVVCGTGPMEIWCKEFVEQHRVNIELRGFVPNTEVRKLVANSKALILPTQWYEGFPMSIVEAFSVGTPVICSNLGNAGSIVEEGVTGCLFRADSTEDIINAVKRCDGMCESTMSEFNKKYSNIRNFEMMKKIYARISSGGGYNVKPILCYNIETYYMLGTCNPGKQVAA